MCLDRAKPAGNEEGPDATGVRALLVCVVGDYMVSDRSCCGRASP